MHYYNVRRSDKMKNLRIFVIISAFLLVLSGCRASDLALNSKTEALDGGYFFEDSMEAPMESPEAEAITEEAVFDSASSVSGKNSYPANRKLIRTFDISAETLEFETFISDLKKAVSELGGYIENSSVSGNSYNYSSNRSASFTCRIPSGKLDEFINTVNGLGNVTYSYEDTVDVTLDYVDTEARIKSLQTEYDQLLELLSEAENIDTIILLQQRLTDVRYQLESYQSMLRTYDNLVDYSTVHLNVNEVRRITAPEQKTVWERITSDFGDNVYNIWVGMQDFFVWFIASIPYFIIWGIIIAVIVIIVRRFIKKSPKWQERRAARKLRKEYKKAQKLAEKTAETDNSENKE